MNGKEPNCQDRNQIPVRIGAALQSVSQNPTVILFVIMGTMILVGTCAEIVIFLDNPVISGCNMSVQETWPGNFNIGREVESGKAVRVAGGTCYPQQKVRKLAYKEISAPGLTNRIVTAQDHHDRSTT